jgi:hypothetical protein
MLNPLNYYEVVAKHAGMFPEIFTFSLKAYLKVRELALSGHRYDVIHDNQCLAYGLLLMKTLGIPVVATIHHPLPIDTRAELAQTTSAWQRFRQLILYPPFMQGIVGRFFYSFGMTVTCAVLLSLFVSFTLTPMLSSRFLTIPGPISSAAGCSRQFSRLLSAWAPPLRIFIRGRGSPVAEEPPR